MEGLCLGSAVQCCDVAVFLDVMVAVSWQCSGCVVPFLQVLARNVSPLLPSLLLLREDGSEG